MTAILLVTLSAVVHASWNYLGKSRQGALLFFAAASAMGGMMLIPFLAAFSGSLRLMPAAAARMLIPAGLFQAVYLIGLGKAYETGDLSAAYPTARALPVLIVPAVSLILGTGEAVHPQALSGMVIISAGILLLPQKSFRSLSFSRTGNRWMAWALLAAAGTVGYSLVDDAALAHFRGALDPAVASLHAPVIYSALESLTTSAFLIMLGLCMKGPSGIVREAKLLKLRSACIAGIGIIGAYCLVLIALGFARNVSYVVAFRQLSLPIGTFLGMMLLGERMTPPKLAGTLLILTGLVMVALG